MILASSRAGCICAVPFKGLLGPGPGPKGAPPSPRTGPVAPSGGSDHLGGTGHLRCQRLPRGPEARAALHPHPRLTGEYVRGIDPVPRLCV